VIIQEKSTLKKKYKTIKCIIFALFILNTNNIFASGGGALSQPSGQYGVGFEDFYWVNEKSCPDFNFNGKNTNDFSSENTNYCHEIVARIYYPTKKKYMPKSLYYKSFISWKRENILIHLPNIGKKQIKDLNDLKSYAVYKTPIITSEKFPVLLFLPGFGYPAQTYENSITELVSHGYIVVGINTPFLNLTELKNSHVVKVSEHITKDEFENKWTPLQFQNLLYSFEKIHNLHRENKNDLFLLMDLDRIGLLGHSIGARVLADAVHAHHNYFQAAVTLDIGFDRTGSSRKKFQIPFMHIIAADRKLASLASDNSITTFELGENNYLIGIAKNEKDHNYSTHTNFTDMSTLQYLTAFQTLDKYLKKHSLGTGNGVEITESVNTYLVAFFDHFLKNKENMKFKNCLPLSKNTYIKCGPGNF
jgi:hypothetical protein